jgi:hypothetical protein
VTFNEEKLRKVWRQMKRRCTVPTDGKYPRYGGRGIKVCDEWQDFEIFRSWSVAAEYAEGLSINRIDNDGNYEPANCEWTDRITQANNSSRNHLVTAFGEIKTLAQWSRDPRCVVTKAALGLRINRRKWEPERALTTPTIKNNNEATHCPSGHEYTPDNITWDGPDKSWRKCKECGRDRAHRWYHEGPVNEG